MQITHEGCGLGTKILLSINNIEQWARVNVMYRCDTANEKGCRVKIRYLDKEN